MKIYQELAKKVLFVAILSLVSLIPVANALAQENNPSIYIPQGTVENNMYFGAGANVNIDGEMKDDVYIAGANIVINGPVEGDVIAAGQNVTINGDVKGNVRAVGSNIQINGKIGRNLTTAGAFITINPKAEIGGNMMAAGGFIEVNGKIGKNFYGTGGTVTLNSEILGNAMLYGDTDTQIVINPKANIHGNLLYTADKPAQVMAGAQIQGEKKFTQLVKTANTLAKPNLGGIMIVIWFVMLLGALVVGLLLIAAFKGFVEKTQANIDKNKGILMLWGLLYAVVTPIVCIILVVTVVGLPLALMILPIYFILMYISKIIVGIYIGKRIFKNKSVHINWQMILGVVIISILFAIPYVGWLFKFLASIWGLGVIIDVLKKEFKWGSK